MEPRQQGLQGGGERIPMQGTERRVRAVPEMPIGQPEAGRERGPEAGEVQAEAIQAAIPATPTLPPVPAVAQPVPVLPQDDDDIPITANDDDLIEKEWVDKAKQIITETKDDPYARERAISKLQIEYIRRRYGREIGDSGN